MPIKFNYGMYRMATIIIVIIIIVIIEIHLNIKTQPLPQVYLGIYYKISEVELKLKNMLIILFIEFLFLLT